MILEKKVSIPTKWEYVIPILATTSLIVSCIIVSFKKFFWNDELLSFYLLNDPSFTHMMTAWGDKFNQSPPLYFIFGWLWAKAFNATELSLRLFSSLTLGAAFTLIWITLRRNYDFWATSIGSLSAFCLSDLVLYHNSEVRMYGLFAAVCALGLLQFDILNKRQKNSWEILIVNTLIHGAIVLTHLYGILYSGAIFFAFVLSDRYFKLFRLNVYLSVIWGWLFLLPFVAPILNQADNSAKWFHSVSGTEFFSYFTISPIFPILILILLVTSVFLQLNQTSSSSTVDRTNNNFYQKSQIPLLIISITFIIVPLLAWIITLTIKPLLNSRYIIPTITVSWSILLAYLSTGIFTTFTSSLKGTVSLSSNYLSLHKQRAILLALITILLVYPIYQAKKTSYYSYSPQPGINDIKYGHSDLPIAMEAGHDFLPRFYYSPKPSRYFHILDWETALNNTSSVFATGDYTHLEALKRNYPFLNIIQSQDFIDKYQRFLVLNEEDQKWFETRIQNNPIYKIKSFGIVDKGAVGPLELFLVERKE